METNPVSGPELLFHISDTPDIARFDPRPAPPAPENNPARQGEMVWAVDHKHIHNYLLPRDCPRVTFYAVPQSKPEDIDRLMAGSSAKYVVAIESGWLLAAIKATLYIYVLPADGFALYDAGAGYYISREPVSPLSVRRVDNLLAELLSYDLELRVMPSLWKLYDAVIASSLQFSIIRMRNAHPR